MKRGRGTQAGSEGADRDRERRVPPLLAYGLPALACLAAGLTNSALTRPKIEGFYRELQKPAFTPPDWAFPVAWTLLYLFMVVAAGRIARQPPGEMRRQALVLFGVQLMLGVAWSWMFFGQESPAAALLAMVVLLAAVAATALSFSRLDRPAGLMLVPLLAWVTYAGALNAAIVSLN